VAEWSIAAVLKTADCNRSGGSNPSFSAKSPVSKLETGLFREPAIAGYSGQLVIRNNDEALLLVHQRQRGNTIFLPVGYEGHPVANQVFNYLRNHI